MLGSMEKKRREKTRIIPSFWPLQIMHGTIDTGRVLANRNLIIHPYHIKV